MKKLVFRFSIILGVIASLLCFVPNHMAKSYAAEEYTQTSYYLLDDSGVAYSSNIEAGSVSGYGSYAVGYQATLNATANDGFNFVGWEIDGNIHSSSFSETFDNTDAGIDNGATVDYTISTNGLRTTSSLTISKGPKDLIVRAVFDYNYFSFSLSEEIIDALALNEDKLTIGADEVSVFYPVDKTDGDTTIAYKTENSGIITYTNAIVN